MGLGLPLFSDMRQTLTAWRSILSSSLGRITPEIIPVEVPPGATVTIKHKLKVIPRLVMFSNQKYGVLHIESTSRTNVLVTNRSTATETAVVDLVLYR